jgi:hypothetical protein
MKQCPICKEKNVRNFYVDADLTEFTESQVNDLTTHEKEIAAQSECLECYHSDVTEYFKSEDEGNEPFDLFESLASCFRPNSEFRSFNDR